MIPLRVSSAYPIITRPQIHWPLALVMTSQVIEEGDFFSNITQDLCDIFSEIQDLLRDSIQVGELFEPMVMGDAGEAGACDKCFRDT